jgi:hypothetical protein
MEFPEKKNLVSLVQKHLNIPNDGIDGPKTWNAILQKFNIPTTELENKKEIIDIAISEKAYNLILKYEVGGGFSYYNKALKNPTYPGGASGVTIGIGYDLGYNTKSQFASDWKHLLSPTVFSRLEYCTGVKGEYAKQLVRNVRDIEVSWDAASDVFKKSTLPRFISETLKAFPGADKLHPDAFGALVSIVFNRGASVTGDSRREMLNIRNLISSKNYNAIANEIRSMKRLWVGKGLDGLLKRRDEEAQMVDSCG